MVLSVTPAVQNFDVACSLGLITNTNGSPYQILTKYGQNMSVSAVTTGLWSRGTNFVFTQAPKRVRIKAGGSVEDDVGGLGSQSVTIRGLDSEFNLANSRIETNGALASEFTDVAFWRPTSAFSEECGVYGGANTGEIVIENEDLDEVMVIDATDSIANHGMFSIPARHSALIRRIVVLIEGRVNVSFTVFIRKDFDKITIPCGSAQAFRKYPGIPPGIHDLDTGHPIPIPEKSDVYVHAEVGQGMSGDTIASISFDVLLVPNF